MMCCGIYKKDQKDSSKVDDKEEEEMNHQENESTTNDKYNDYIKGRTWKGLLNDKELGTWLIPLPKQDKIEKIKKRRIKMNTLKVFSSQKKEIEDMACTISRYKMVKYIHMDDNWQKKISLRNSQAF